MWGYQGELDALDWMSFVWVGLGLGIMGLKIYTWLRWVGLGKIRFDENIFVGTVLLIPCSRFIAENKPAGIIIGRQDCS